MTPTITKKEREIIALALNDLEIQPESEEAQIGTILLGSAIVGADEDVLAITFAIPLERIREWGDNLRASGIWRDGRVYANWFDEENGGLELLLDLLVAQGLMERGDGDG